MILDIFFLGVFLRKRFFFEKKKQKLLVFRPWALKTARHKVTRVFWFFFSKKNVFPRLKAVDGRFRGHDAGRKLASRI